MFIFSVRKILRVGKYQSLKVKLFSILKHFVGIDIIKLVSKIVQEPVS